MKKRIAYWSGLFLVLNVCLLPSSFAQEVTKEELQQTTVQLKQEFDAKIKSQLQQKDSTLKRAEDLYTKANQHIGLTEKLDNWFIGILGFLAALIFGIIGLAGYNLIQQQKALKEFKTQLQQEREKLAQQASQEINVYKEQIKKDLSKEFNEKLKTNLAALQLDFEKARTSINRIMRTEENTIYIKEQARILFLYKSGTKLSHNNLSILQRLIKNEFSHTGDLEIRQLSDALHPAFNEFLSAKDPLKIVVMDDQLFEEYKTKDGYSAEGSSAMQHFFDQLNQNETVFFNVGRSQLREFEITYKGYANEAYSAYSNINNVLKYMMAGKNLLPASQPNT